MIVYRRRSRPPFRHPRLLVVSAALLLVLGAAVARAEFDGLPLPAARAAGPARPAVSSTLVVNEVDYDQPGSDTAEFAEIKNVGASGIDLDAYVLTFVNGSTGVPYRTIDLPAVSLAPGDYYVVCGLDGNVPNCDLSLGLAQDVLQNDLEAVAIELDGSVVDTLSYEGSVVGYTEGTGVPRSASDNNDTARIALARYADGTDTDDNSIDFSLRCISPGAANLPDTGNCTPQTETPTPTASVTETAGPPTTTPDPLTATVSPTASPTETETASETPAPGTPTDVPPTPTAATATRTSEPPTPTGPPPTYTPHPPTTTPAAPTITPVPPTGTPDPLTATPDPPTGTAVPPTPTTWQPSPTPDPPTATRTATSTATPTTTPTVTPTVVPASTGRPTDSPTPDGPPMAVVLVDLTAERVGPNVVVTWRTLSEIDHAGFHVWRAADDDLPRPLTPRLIQGAGEELAGADYRWLDRNAPGGVLRYWIADVDTRGLTTWHGPVHVAARRPSSRALDPLALATVAHVVTVLTGPPAARPIDTLPILARTACRRPERARPGAAVALPPVRSPHSTPR